MLEELAEVEVAEVPRARRRAARLELTVDWVPMALGQSQLRTVSATHRTQPPAGRPEAQRRLHLVVAAGVVLVLAVQEALVLLVVPVVPGRNGMRHMVLVAVAEETVLLTPGRLSLLEMAAFTVAVAEEEEMLHTPGLGGVLKVSSS